jgi:hypothetical protein
VPDALRETVDAALVKFGEELRPLFVGPGDPEPRLYAPFYNFLKQVGIALDMVVVSHAQTRLPELHVRPDYAVAVDGVVVGHVELKRWEHGVNPQEWPAHEHDRKQWEKLKVLPNVLYCDGRSWALYRAGERFGPVVRVAGEIGRSPLASPDASLARLLQEFVGWQPSPPRTIDQLVRTTARLCRLMRDEVREAVRLERSDPERARTFTNLAEDWRTLLFPEATDDEFANGYAQTVTFGLLLAHRGGIPFQKQTPFEIAGHLSRRRSLMGKALEVLTEHLQRQEFDAAVNMLVRVLAVVDWDHLPGAEELHVKFYEPFLEAYDPGWRQRTGSYYTPPPVTRFMVRFGDHVLRERFGNEMGFAEPTVTVVDPAMGTGSFLAEIIETVVHTVRTNQGEEAVPAQLHALSRRMIGLEKQIAPFAVAEWHIHAPLLGRRALGEDDEVRLYIADTLQDPYEDEPWIISQYEPIFRSRRQANAFKRTEPVMVAISNPPWGDNAKGRGFWIERGDPAVGIPPPLDAFRSPGRGRHEQKLWSLHVYFWRWATWKVFDAHPEQPSGLIVFISPSAYLTGPGLAGLRRYLRERADEGWIVDLSPEDMRPPKGTRVFPDVKQRFCIGVFARYGQPNQRPARVHYLALAGTREQKFARLDELTPDDPEWTPCQADWEAPFRPAATSLWAGCPGLDDLMPWSAPGVKPNRSWVYAPNQTTLGERWRRLSTAALPEKRTLLKETRDRTIDSRVASLRSPGEHETSLARDRNSARSAPMEMVAYRSFDRQWLLFDNRVIDFVRPELWLARGPKQLYMSELHTGPITRGPGVTFDAHVPDMHCYRGHSGGRVLPLYRDADGLSPNVTPGLLAYLADRLALAVSPSDLIAYIAAVVAHGGYTHRFANELRTPGVRVPLTSSADLWRRALDLGDEVLWLYTWGERFNSPSSGRPSGRPRLPLGDRPRVLVAIPHHEGGMPETISYVAATRTLHVGSGAIGPVRPEVWDYEVSGMRVVRHWFGYRKRQPDGVRSSPLNDVRARRWGSDTTTELLDLLQLLTRLVELEPAQQELLDEIMSGLVITTSDLVAASVLPVPPEARRPPRRQRRPKRGQQDLPFLTVL